MHRSIRLVAILAVVGAVFATAKVAHANHYWEITAVTCDPGTNTITITGEYDDFSSSADTFIYVNGTYLAYIDPLPTVIGTIVFTYTDAAFVDGAIVHVDDADQAGATTTCGDPFEGPGIPAGFELHYLNCSTVVYDEPGGNPVNGEAVWAGQSWYINPKFIADDSGKLWAEVFVSSPNLVYIPASCVN